SSSSVGQISYVNATGSNGSSSQGVQQPYEIYALASSDLLKELNIDINVYPNPTSSAITIKIEGAKDETFYYELFDPSGKLIQQAVLQEPQSSIDLQSIAPSAYLLVIKTSDLNVKSFRIIKQH
ncbi:MAG: T9SS type A sorting domain-containing protein, partial [Flavobacteriales bacterium]|nr:T9SS type A sorting domain-containing protein [Flavobacteriales bacterium]